MIFKQKLFLTLLILSQIFVLNIYSQSPTTEGKEFWLSFMTNEKTPELSINVSAKKACTLTIKNINTGYVATAALTPGLNKISPKLTPIAQCYVSTSELVEKKSLLITSTDTISLFASNYVSKVFDISGILPVNALLDEYMIQTYTNSSEKQEYAPEFLIVATENNTVVDIIPTWKTAAGKPANQSFSVTLNKGECYQVQAEYDVLNSDLSGSLVTARNGKKIAVFNGNQSEAIPVTTNKTDSILSGGNDGDHLFEQAMPVAFWGTHFVITRSLNRAIDKVRITARNDDTKIKRNGTVIATLQSGQTHEMEIKWPDVSCYIETTCPCAVYEYLTSSHQYDASKLGGPSMIWISPVEQMIKEISFCTYNTANTSNHYINLVTLTANAANVTLTGKSTGNKPLTFKPVTGNPEYSFARTTLLDDSYTLKSKTGVIAHVYGLGGNESYGYSAGSSARLQKGISINNVPFITNVPDSISCCLGDTLSFICEMKNIESISWDLGNGDIKTDTAFKYAYKAYGSYNLVVKIKSYFNLCDNTGLITTISTKIKVRTAEEKHYYVSYCLPNTPQNSLHTTNKITPISYQCDSIVYMHETTKYETYYTDTKVAFDSLKWMDGKTYYESISTPTFMLKNKAGCDSIITLNLTVQKCLDVSVDNAVANLICSNESGFSIPYTIKKGTFNRYETVFDAKAIQSGFSKASVTDNGTSFIVTFPSNVVPNEYVLNLSLFDDNVCGRSTEFKIPFTVKYSGVISQKWNDVLAISSKTGYEFSGFQWYKNGELIEGATGPYYYTGINGSKLDFTAEYTVELTRSDGVKIMSCPVNPKEKTPLAGIVVYPTSTSIGNSVNIVSSQDGTATLIHPLGIQQSTFPVKSGDNSFRVPAKSGVYVLNLVLGNGEQESFRIIVK